MSANFEKYIAYNGTYSCHYLIKIYDVEKNIVLKFVNNISDVVYNGETYAAAGFSYKPEKHIQGFNGGGTLEIAANEGLITDLILTYGEIRLEATSVIIDNGTVEEGKTFKNHYGKATYKGGKISISFNQDDRPGMTFPALIWNATNNHGNN